MNDTASIQDGKRSKSQVSVFDYPEHLNPFYEDDHHKRLRFWKLPKKDGTTSRRGSFSLDGLREMWTFKSFRSKKKSSTLGINKTSESPEPLRRIYRPNESLYATMDARNRNTYDNSSLNNNFQRNVPYRTSLQDMNYSKGVNSNGNGIGFLRNDNYRSTIQIIGRNGSNNNNNYSGSNTPMVPARRYVYGGSITPQPRTRYDHNSTTNTTSCSQGISRGSSQLSIASSTNPFEEDGDDDDDVTIGSRISSSESTDRPTPTKRRVKKKRRAPPPPVPIPKIIDEETSSISTSPTNHGTSDSVPQTTKRETITTTAAVITTTPPRSTPTDDETSSQDNNFENQLQRQSQLARDFSEQENQEISNIAAEIEHYVKLLTQEDEDESAVRLIPISKPIVLKKSKSSTSILKSPSPSKIKKSGSENLMRSLFKEKEIPTKVEVTKWCESLAKQQNEETAKKFTEFRRNSLKKPTPATRQHPKAMGNTRIESTIGDKKFTSAERKSESPEASSSTCSSQEKPIPPARYYSSTDSEEIRRDAVASPRKNEVVSNGVLPNSPVQHTYRESNSFDQQSASSKEHTPLNSSYSTTTDESIPPTVELKITESREDISDISNTSSERYQIRYVPLKDGSPDSPSQSRADFKVDDKPNNNNYTPDNSNYTSIINNIYTSAVTAPPIQSNYNESWVPDQEPRRPNVTVERRRSVKEIIDSINRSQSLLKVNQDPQKSSKPANISTSSALVNDLNGVSDKTSRTVDETSAPQLSQQSIDLEESYLRQSEDDIKRMILEMENLAGPREMGNYCDNVPSILDRFDEEVNNNDIFKKCVLKKQLIREGSPTASNLDWNPLPKPKRTKNLSAELNSSKNGK